MSKSGVRARVGPWRTATIVLTIVSGVAGAAAALSAHGFGSAITWNREISRIVYDRCASCHRPEGSAFSLMTYADVQPRANEIKEAVLSRRMPPWGAVKGFGHFRNDQSLTQEQIELFSRWVDSGIRRGNNPRLLPKTPDFGNSAPFEIPKNAVTVQGSVTLRAPIVLDGVVPIRVAPGRSLRIVAALPDGGAEPLVWLHDYDSKYAHAFLLRSPLRLPAGTTIQGVTAETVIGLIPAAP